MPDIKTPDDASTVTASGPPHPPRQRLRAGQRRWLFRCIALFGAAVVALVLCEIVLWIMAPLPFHEWAIWEPEGHIRGRLLPNQVILTATGHEFRVNKYGFRGPDYTWEKPAGTLRLEVFGGSSALCYKAAGEDKTWPKALELKLRQRLNMPVEVINLALAGFDSFNCKINYLCYGRAFHPDAVLLYDTFNDMAMFRRLEKEPYVPAEVHGAVRPLWQRIARATQLGRRARIAQFILVGQEMDIKARPQEHTGKDMDRPVPPHVFAWERQNFVDFAVWARQDNVLPVLVTEAGLGSPDNLEDPEIRLTFVGGCVERGFTPARAVDTWLQICAIIKDVAAQHDAIFVDGYNTVPHDLKHIQDNVHMFDRGAEVLAEKIANVLLKDPRFLTLVERVRGEGKSSSGGAAAATQPSGR